MTNPNPKRSFAVIEKTAQTVLAMEVSTMNTLNNFRDRFRSDVIEQIELTLDRSKRFRALLGGFIFYERDRPQSNKSDQGLDIFFLRSFIERAIFPSVDKISKNLTKISNSWDSYRAEQFGEIPKFDDFELKNAALLRSAYKHFAETIDTLARPVETEIELLFNAVATVPAIIGEPTGRDKDILETCAAQTDAVLMPALEKLYESLQDALENWENLTSEFDNYE